MAASGGLAMTREAIKAFYDGFIRAWERQDVAALSACYSDDCVVESPIFHTLNGRAEVERSYSELFRAFAHQTVRVDELVICDEPEDRAVIVWTVQSSHVGEIMGVPASGKRIERTLAYFQTLGDGQIVKEARIYDFTAMLMQLGVLKVKAGG
jgi:steroid delta-isomerase-like uncharacterized protein